MMRSPLAAIVCLLSVLAPGGATAQTTIDTDPDSRGLAQEARACQIQYGDTDLCMHKYLMSARYSDAAGIYGTSGDSSRAALRMMDRMGALDSREAAQAWTFLARSLSALNDIKSAKSAFVMAFGLTKDQFGEQSKELRDVMAQMGFLLLKTNELAGAERLMREVLDRTAVLEGAASVGYAQSLANLAQVLERRGKAREALAIQSEAIRRFRPLLASQPILMAEKLNRYSATLLTAGRWNEAENAAREALSVLDRAGLSLKMQYDLYNKLSVALREQGRLDDAMAAARLAARLAIAGFPWDKTPEAEALTELARAQIDAGDYADAETNLRTVAAAMAPNWIENDQRRADNRADLAASLLPRCKSLPEARSAASEASDITLARISAVTDYDGEAASALRRSAPLFRQQVAIAWSLGNGCPPE